MPYLVASDLPSESAGRRFRQLLKRPRILKLPGTHNGMAALQAKGAGFEALYLSGAAMTASMGLPDLGIITVDEVCFFIRQIVRASGLPLLVDADTGYGEALNVMDAVRVFEDAGAGALHLEDQFLPKKCGHLNDKKLVDAHVGYYFQQVTDDFGAPPALDGFRSRVAAVGPQVGFLFPVGDMQGYINLKGYKEFDARNRPEGWNTWLTFAISPKAPEPASPPPISRKY
jgi:hypothetical protein